MRTTRLHAPQWAPTCWHRLYPPACLPCLPARLQTPTRDDILSYLSGKIARWWMPDDVVFVKGGGCCCCCRCCCCNRGCRCCAFAATSATAVVAAVGAAAAAVSTDPPCLHAPRSPLQRSPTLPPARSAS